MGIRESLNDRPAATAGAMVVFILVAVGFFGWWHFYHEAPRPVVEGRCFFSADDGLTYFSGKMSLAPSYTIDGKPAVRCYVFSCDGGKTKQVCYLERRLPTSSGVPLTEVKKPGPGLWFNSGTAAAAEITHVICPEGGEPMYVEPDSEK